MPERSAGEASVRIVPSTKNFLNDLKADLERKNAEFAVKVTADTTRAATDLDRFRAEQERRPIKIRTEVDRSGLDQMKKGLSEAGSALGSALKFNLGAAGIGELPALATAVTTVAGSLQQLAGAGAVIPGVFAAIGADVGTAKLALLGVSDAFKAVDKASDGSAKNIAAANEALAKLAPQTADFVREVSGLKPAFDSLQKDVSGKFFDDLGTSVRNLAAADLPILQKGLAGIATAFNQNLKQLGGSLGSDSSKGLLDRILGNTGDAQARLSKAIDPIVHAFGTLAATGSDTLPSLADGVGKLADRFDHFISAADSSGKLDKWIQDGIEGFDHLGNTLLNIGKIVTDLTGAAGGGGGLLNWLDQGSTKLHEFLSSTQGQETLREFFADGREELAQLLPILQNLGPIAQGAFQAARDATQLWAPIIKEVTDVLASDPQLVKDIAEAFLAWKFVGVITGVSDAVKGIATALGLVGPAAAAAGTEGAAGLAPLLATLGPLAAAMAAITGGSIVGSDALDAYAKNHPESTTTGVYGPGAPAVRRSGQGAAGVPQPLPGIPGGGGPGAQSERRGGAPFDPTHGLLLPGHATGGVLPGYSPGKDNMLVPLAGGEGIVRPEVVKKFGPGFIHRLNRGFATGGIVDEFGNPVTPGPLPGPAPVAPNPYQGGVGSIANSFLSGLSGVAGNVSGLINQAAGTGQTGQTGGTGVNLTPGLAGLVQAGNNPELLSQWGNQTGDWLGKFASKTLLSFGTTLWQGALGTVGLENSILSPSNPWFQDASKTAGFFLGQDGPFGSSSTGDSATKPATAKQLREADDKIARTDGNVAETLARLNELGPDAKGSARISAQNSYNEALRESDEAKSDRDALAQGQSASSVTSSAARPTSGTSAARWRPVITQALQQIGPKYGITNISAWTDAMIGQIQFESHGDPNAFNPKDSDGLPAIGLAQFKQGTFNAHNVTGGSINDPTAQIYAMVDYVATRYGQSSSGVPNGINRGHGYRVGGDVPGSGSGDTVPALLTPGEHVLTTKDVAALGGQGGVYALRAAIHMAGGGEIFNSGAVIWPRQRLGPDGKDMGGKPGRDPGQNPNQIAIPDWGTPGTKFGPPPKDWWTKPIDPNDVLFPDQWGQRPWGKHPLEHQRIQPLGFDKGNEVPGAYIKPLPPRPNFKVPDIQPVRPRPAPPRPPAAVQPPAQPIAPPAAVVPEPPPEQQQPAYAGAPAPIGAAPSTQSHTLPAISKGITSGFATAGALAQQAASLGMMAASGGASALGGGGGGGLGGGGGGPSIQGLFQQFGKIANDVVDVGSAFLVGNVTNGTTANPYGETLRPAQNVPITAPARVQNNTFHGMDVPKVFQELDLRGAQDQQAALAHRPVR